MTFIRDLENSFYEKKNQKSYTENSEKTESAYFRMIFE